MYPQSDSESLNISIGSGSSEKTKLIAGTGSSEEGIERLICRADALPAQAQAAASFLCFETM